MNILLTTMTYGIYLLLSLLLTVWVGRTLFRNGRLFLVRSLEDVDLADSVNHLLIVGFYLLNLGYVSLMLRTSTPPSDLVEMIELLSVKFGWVCLMVGIIHFANLFIISKMNTAFHSLRELPSDPA